MDSLFQAVYETFWWAIIWAFGIGVVLALVVLGIVFLVRAIRKK